jgi:membrane protein DedA with SNARE-associated domain
MISASVLQVGGLAAYLIVFAIAASETSALVGLLVPGETLVLAAGALAAQGYFDVTRLIIAVVAGAIVGDSIGYGIGRWYRSRQKASAQAGESQRGKRDRRPGWLARLIGGDRIQRAEALLARRGGLAIFVGRFIGFVRSLLPFVAGAAGMGYRRFLAYDVPAAIAWSVSSVLAGLLLGESAGQLFSLAGMGAVVVLAAAAIVVLLIVSVRKVVRTRRRTAESHGNQRLADDRDLVWHSQSEPREVKEDEEFPLSLTATRISGTATVSASSTPSSPGSTPIPASVELARTTTSPAPASSISPAYLSFIVGIWSIGSLSVTPWIAPPSLPSPRRAPRHRAASSRRLCGTTTGSSG